MTDIINTTLTTPSPWFPLRLQFPKWSPKWAVCPVLANFSETIRRMIEMAYVAPFFGSKPTPLVGPDETLEGRDPNW